ncbi:MAG: SMI1/KNR4 family protein, partial [Deltaproteobacteria bacterium]|nr:SMI1/KNR4 family protein [Deltaproteobacteria bacterium]
FYAAHDGADGVAVADGEDLLSIDEIGRSWTGLRAVWSEIGDRQPGLWSAAWLPITHDGSGSYLCADLAADGVPVLRYWLGEPARPRIASSFADWLAQVEWTVEEA